MSEEKKPQEEGFNFKAERFFGKNWYLIAALSFITVFYALYTAEKTAGAIQDLEKIVRDNNLYTIMTTTDGRAIKVVKQKVEAKFIEKWIVKTLATNLIVSRSELTNNYKINAFKSAKDVIANSYKLQFIWSDLLNQDNKMAVNDFKSYLVSLKALLGEDKLPETFTINNYTVESFNFNQNKFETKIHVKVGTTNYNISKDEHYEKIGTITILARGQVDLSKSTELNPYGLVMDAFKIKLVTK
jgi:hypothetical protein